jgi:REP element-mobilizing transposase RayT
MPYREAEFAPGEYYHIYNRGAGRMAIFQEADNYLYLLRLVKRSSAELGVSLIAYCLMPNHYHLLVRQDGHFAAGLLPAKVFNSYTKAFNKRYDRTGTLLQGRFQAIRVDKDAYLTYLCAYIHGNPVKAGLVSDPAGWPYSNYLEWIGARNGRLVDYAVVRGYFPRAGEYEQFVGDYLSGVRGQPAGFGVHVLDQAPVPGSRHLRGDGNLGEGT